MKWQLVWFFACWTSIANAEIFVLADHGDGNPGGFAGDFQLGGEWNVGGEAGQGFVMSNVIDNSSSSGQVLLDTNASTVSYQGLTVTAYSNITRVRRWTVPDGFNPNKVFTLYSNLDPMDIFVQSNNLELPVLSVTSGAAQTAGIPLSDMEPILVNFSGNFTLEGPTESITDTFSGTATLSTGHINFDPYGTEISLDRDSSGAINLASIFTRIRFDYDDIPLITTTIDGVAFDLRLTNAVAHHRLEGASSVPEPSAAAMLAICGTGIAMLRRKRRD